MGKVEDEARGLHFVAFDTTHASATDPYWTLPRYNHFDSLDKKWDDLTRTYLKKWILVQNQGGREVQAGGILSYFEDLNRAPNAEFGPKDFFEMGSNLTAVPP